MHPSIWFNGSSILIVHISCTWKQLKASELIERPYLSIVLFIKAVLYVFTLCWFLIDNRNWFEWNIGVPTFFISSIWFETICAVVFAAVIQAAFYVISKIWVFKCTTGRFDRIAVRIEIKTANVNGVLVIERKECVTVALLVRFELGSF